MTYFFNPGTYMYIYKYILHTYFSLVNKWPKIIGNFNTVFFMEKSEFKLYHQRTNSYLDSRRTRHRKSHMFLFPSDGNNGGTVEGCDKDRADVSVRMMLACERYIRGQDRCREALLWGNNNIIDSGTLKAPLLPCPLILVAQQHPLLFLQ